jgi:hypothetical protein
LLVVLQEMLVFVANIFFIFARKYSLLK